MQSDSDWAQKDSFELMEELVQTAGQAHGHSQFASEEVSNFQSTCNINVHEFGEQARIKIEQQQAEEDKANQQRAKKNLRKRQQKKKKKM